MRQRRGVLVVFLVVGAGVLGGVALADGKHFVQVGDDVVDVVRRIGTMRSSRSSLVNTCGSQRVHCHWEALPSSVSTAMCTS